MAGDLEDFLRRAAVRRQQKAAQQQQAPQRRPEQPQYSDSRTERVSRDRDREPEEPVLTAEIVADDPVSHLAQLHRAEEAKRAAVKAKRQAKKSAERNRQKQAKKGSGTPLTQGSTGKPAQDLVNLIKQPGGIQQAILLREILDRPVHRW